MELWVRSQDKINLVKINRQVSLKYNNRKMIIADYVGDNGYGEYYEYLGTYKSEKRALQILDEIQNTLKPMLIFENCTITKEQLDKARETGAIMINSSSRVEQLSTYVYEMPEE